MANGRAGARPGKYRRIEGGFTAIPSNVLDSYGYLQLSHLARSMLIEVARQYKGTNNGRLLMSLRFLSKRGWSSSSSITSAKKDLIAGGFIFETVIGHRPNKASQFAITWHSLDTDPRFDEQAKNFQRGAYLNKETGARNKYKNDPTRPRGGATEAALAPQGGSEGLASIPRGGAIKVQSGMMPAPPHEHHI